MRKNIPSAAQVRGWDITEPSEPADNPTPESETAETQTPVPGELRYGFTLADLDRAAWIAVTRNRKWWAGSDRLEQMDIARSGAVEYLYGSDTAPTENDLVYAARVALSDEVNGYKQMFGISHRGGTAPQFAKYWHHVADEPWVERLIEGFALKQIWPRLTQAQREALTAFAASADYAEAAQLLGISLRALRSRLYKARTAFSEYWYAPEAPGRRKADKRVGSYARPRRTHCHRCPDGHEFTDENAYTSTSGSWVCKVYHRSLVSRRDAAVAARKRGASDVS